MDTINIKIDNKNFQVAEGTTILEAAKSVGVNIPTLCYMHLHHLNTTHKPTGCRMCVVEVAGRKNLVPACATECLPGMEIKNQSIRVLNSRKTVLELILSDHPTDCLICAKNGDCDLQSMAQEMGIRHLHYQGEQSHYIKDRSPAIKRDMDKCIGCGRCLTMCNDVQTVGALSAINRGFMSVVAPAFQMNLEESVCTYCGQCVAVCPTAALTEIDHTKTVIRHLADPSKTVIVQTAPAVRVALGEEFGYDPGTIVTGKMTAALKDLGFDYVFDTDFAADLTIMEEATELLDRLTRHLNGDTTVKLPLLTSCCPGWVSFFEHHFPDMKDIPSTARSPQQMFGSIAKTYLADKLGIKRKDMIVVSIMPCLAKKYECSRDEFATDGNPDVDFVLSTRELARLIKQAGIDFKSLEHADFDKPMGESSGAAVIFGSTGGVIEAAVRTAYEVFTNQKLHKVDFEQLRGMDWIRESTIDFNGTPIKIGIAHGLGNARKLLEEIREGKSLYHAIEIMACPGGCIGGGGQPLLHGDSNILLARQKAIYTEDKGKMIRKSHENPSVKKLYEEFLGSPMSKKAHELLHTQYFDKSNPMKITKD